MVKVGIKVCDLNFHAKNLRSLHTNDKSGSHDSAAKKPSTDAFEPIIDRLPLEDTDQLRCVWSPQCP